MFPVFLLIVRLTRSFILLIQPCLYFILSINFSLSLRHTAYQISYSLVLSVTVSFRLHLSPPHSFSFPFFSIHHIHIIPHGLLSFHPIPSSPHRLSSNPAPTPPKPGPSIRIIETSKPSRILPGSYQRFLIFLACHTTPHHTLHRYLLS